MGIKQYRKVFKDILEKTFLPEGSTDKERNDNLLPLSMWLVAHQPIRVTLRQMGTVKNEGINEGINDNLTI